MTSTFAALQIPDMDLQLRAIIKIMAYYVLVARN